MGIRSSKPLYQLLEQALRKAKKPLTCVELMEQDLIRTETLKDFGPDVQIATNKLSDTLGFMWRKGLLVRFPASKETRAFARYAYAWDTKSGSQEPSSPVRFPSTKQSFSITENDQGVTLEFDKFIVIIRSK